jgi:rsbT co-antagonist protein RsbR
MTDSIQGSSSQVVMREMGLTEANIERRRKIIGIDSRDLSRIGAIRDLVSNAAEGYTAAFFEHLAGLEEARALMGNRPLLERARQLKREHLFAMVQGEYGLKYAEQRIELALLYSKVNLETPVFLGAFHHLLTVIGASIMKHDSSGDGFDKFTSLKKIAFFDIGLIVDALVFERERIIVQQQEAIRELSTPVLQIRERLLLLPIIGVIDTHRARLITEGLLRSIRGNRAKVVVMDVTGVATIDSKVANHLIQTVTAARLMGAAVIVTGLSSEVAQSLVALGIELNRLNTVGDLQGGLEEAEAMLGYRMQRSADDVASTPAFGS